MVIPWARSSLRASSRNAYSNGRPLRSQSARTCSSLPSGSAPVSARSRPTTVLFPWSTWPPITTLSCWRKGSGVRGQGSGDRLKNTEAGSLPPPQTHPPRDRRLLHRRDLLHRLAELGVGGRIHFAERRHHVGDPAVLADDEQGTVVHPLAAGEFAERAIPAADHRTEIAQEGDGVSLVPGPGRLGGIRIRADREDLHVVAGAEELRVLITVRVHLNRSALGPGLVEERQHHGLPPQILEVHRLGAHPLLGGGGRGSGWRRRRGRLLGCQRHRECRGGGQREGGEPLFSHPNSSS